MNLFYSQCLYAVSTRCLVNFVQTLMRCLLFIAVVALKELKNSRILVFISFATNSENTSSKADGLKQSKESKQFRNSSQNFSLSLVPLLINKLGGFLYKRRSILFESTFITN